MKRFLFAAFGLVLLGITLTGCTKQITVPANSDTTCTVHTNTGLN